jgi:hypothetical protein
MLHRCLALSCKDLTSSPAGWSIAVSADGGRVPAPIGGPDVWEVIAAARSAPERGEKRVHALAERIGVPVERVRIAVRYYSEYRDEVHRFLAANEQEAEQLERALEDERHLLGSSCCSTRCTPQPSPNSFEREGATSPPCTMRHIAHLKANPTRKCGRRRAVFWRTARPARSMANRSGRFGPIRHRAARHPTVRSSRRRWSARPVLSHARRAHICQAGSPRRTRQPPGRRKSRSASASRTCGVATARSLPTTIGARATKNPAFAGFFESGRPDLNRGPHRPERCALPGCATPRIRPV